MSISLAALKPGQSGVIVGYTAFDELVQRLMQMGLVEGTRVEVVRYALTGDPIEIRVMDYALSLRKAEASTVLIDDVR